MTVIHTKRKQPEDVSSTGNENNTRYTCDSCFSDISRVVRAQCALCDDIDLCLSCLASGHPLANPNHSPHHPYRLLKPFLFPVYEQDWRAEEEAQLLEAVEGSGMGNWGDVAEWMGHNRTAQECKDHYYKLYIDHPDAPLPNPRMFVDSMQDVQSTLSTKKVKIEEPPVVSGYQSFPASHEITGYMPYREEFEVCFDNDAEISIKDLIFTETDTPFDVRLKRCMLDIYSGTLDRRAGRQDFVFHHGLINYKAQVALDKTRSKEEKDVLNQIKPFARFMKANEFDEFVKGLVKEAELRKRIASLQEYRRAGIRKTEEINRYEHEKKQLELYLKSGGAAIIHRPIREPHPIPNIPSRESHNTTPIDSQSTQVSMANQGRKASAPLNISHADGIDLLTEKERELCSILRLYPRVYLHIKDTLIKEYLHHGGLKRAQARAAVKIDVNKTSRLYDFFVAAGWIKPPAGEQS